MRVAFSFRAMTAPSTSFHEEDAIGKVYDRRLVRRLLAYVRPYMALVVAAVALLMLDGLLQLVGPALTERVIDVALPAHDMGFVRTAALIFVASLALQFGAAYGETMLTALLGQRVMRDLRHDIFAHLQRLSIGFFDRNPVGRLITRVTSDVESLNELFTAGVVAGMGDLFTLLAISVMMLVSDWRLALAAFAVIPFVYWVSHVFRIKVRLAYRDIRSRLARINAFLQERITGMRVVQLFGREKDEASQFEVQNRGHLDANLKSITVYALYFPAIEVLTTVALASLIVTGGRRVELGAVSLGTVAAFLQLARRFFQPLQDLSDKFNTLQQAMAASERIFNLLDTEPELRVQGLGSGVQPIGGTAPSGVLGDGARRRETPNPRPAVVRRSVTVTFEDVWFAYERPHSDGKVAESAPPEWVLKGVSFRAEPGKTLALVGHTGAGKTTIVNLLLRFYDPQRGRICVNGVDIREMPLDELRSLIGYVQQDIFLFAGDVA